MEFKDFKKGEYFFTASGEWLCVDKGIFYVLAVKKELLDGYVEGEESNVTLFDRWDFPGCRKEKF